MAKHEVETRFWLGDEVVDPHGDTNVIVAVVVHDDHFGTSYRTLEHPEHLFCEGELIPAPYVAPFKPGDVLRYRPSSRMLLVVDTSRMPEDVQVVAGPKGHDDTYSWGDFADRYDIIPANPEEATDVR